MRGANINIKNKNGQLPMDCMINDKQKCRTIIKLSTLIQSLMTNAKKGSHYFYHERIVSNDITKSKESFPIQCVNGIDTESTPSDYVYVKNNCVTKAIPIDRNISTLQVCLSFYQYNMFIKNILLAL